MLLEKIKEFQNQLINKLKNNNTMINSLSKKELIQQITKKLLK